MDISNYTSEDFVLDPSFRDWVLHPTAGSNIKWEKLLDAYPSKYPEAEKAREIVIRLNRKNHPKLEDSEFLQVWDKIEHDLTESNVIGRDDKIIPLNSLSTFRRSQSKAGKKELGYRKWIKVACTLFILAFLGLAARWALDDAAVEPTALAPEYEERSTAPGVKAHLTLSDGSEVILNSGSKIRYIKNFHRDKREILLEGEAFFNVAKDSLRPFSVVTGTVKTTALGTSFNIKSYRAEISDIALITGTVTVEVLESEDLPVILEPGEAAHVDVLTSQIKKDRFDEDRVIGWTQKRLVFHETPLSEALEILEKWYGVTIEIQNERKGEVQFNGKFQNESLENVLRGLSYASGFDFEIRDDKVKINFKD